MWNRVCAAGDRASHRSAGGLWPGDSHPSLWRIVSHLGRLGLSAADVSHQFEIAGDTGLIEFDSDSTAPIQNLILKTGGADAPDVALPSSPVSESPYTTQIKEFYHALAEGTPSRISAADGLRAVQIAEAALESAHSGQPVKLQSLAEAA